MMAATYQKTNAVNMASRAPCSLAEVTPGSLSCTNSTSTIGGRAVLPNGQQINFNQVPGGDGDFFEPYNGAKHNNNVQRYLTAVSPIERSEEHTSELQSLMPLSYAVFCWETKKKNQIHN